MKETKTFTGLMAILETFDPKKYIISIKPTTEEYSFKEDTVEIEVHRIRRLKIFGWEFSKKIFKVSYIFDKNTALASIINPDYKDDRKVDVLSFMRYAEKGFNENPVDITEVLAGLDIPPEVLKHLKEFNYRLDLLHCAVGMADEAGEILDHIKKYVYHGKPLDRADIASEFGDYEWYKNNALRLLGITYSDTLKANMIKLDARYPDGRDKNYLTQAKAKNIEGENDLIRQTLYKEEDKE